MNIESLKKILVLLSVLCLFLIFFLNRVIDLSFEDTFTEIFNLVEALDKQDDPYPILMIALSVGFFSYIAGLILCLTGQRHAKLLLSLGAAGLLLNQIFGIGGLSLITIDYAPSMGFRYVWYFLTGSLVTLLYFEDMHINQQSSDE
jgi:hypothetical protein